MTDSPETGSMTPVERFDLSDPEQREAGLAAATNAVRRGELVVLPTDTVYGIGCDAFDASAVAALLEAKGRGRQMPPPVLISSAITLDALASIVPEWVRVLTAKYWPGALTVVLPEQSSLQWDLGDTRGTVAVRMPDDEGARELIERTGPLAVSSANLTGMPAAIDADGAQEMLADRVSVILDGGPARGSAASTIIDATSDKPRFLRVGAISEEEIMGVLADAGYFTEPIAEVGTSETEQAGPTSA